MLIQQIKLILIIVLFLFSVADNIAVRYLNSSFSQYISRSFTSQTATTTTTVNALHHHARRIQSVNTDAIKQTLGYKSDLSTISPKEFCSLLNLFKVLDNHNNHLLFCPSDCDRLSSEYLKKMTTSSVIARISNYLAAVQLCSF